MTDRDEFDRHLSAVLVAKENAVRPPDGLAQRLITGATERRSARHRVSLRGAPRWLPPLLAAAAVVAVVAVGAALAGSPQSQHVPPATHAPTVVPTATAPPSSPTTRVSSPPVSSTHASTAPAGPDGTPVPAGFAAHDVTFLDREHGWGLGNVPCAAAPGYCAVVVRTEDGGGHWRALPAPKGVTPVDDQGNASGGSCGTNGNIYGPCVDRVAFADSLHGYLWSFHSFFMTVDGGATWRDAHARATQLVVSGDTVVRLSPIHDCSSECAGRLQYATVGSTAWHTVQPAGTVPGLFSSQLRASGSSVFFENGPIQGGAAASLYRSVDGGRHWSAVPSGRCPVGDGELSLAPDGTLAMLCGDATDATVRVMAPGRSSFAAARAMPHTADSGSVVGSPQVQMSALSADRMVGFVLPQSADTIPWIEYASADGGGTWHKIGTVETPWTPISATTGYVLTASGSAVAFTGDAGATWSSQPF